MHYYLYEIKNNVNGKIYVGVHKTKNLDDGYMGSGKIIKRAIEKYGLENFTRTILETFDTQEEMFAKEKEIVNEEFLAREDTYNILRGGHGGFDYINNNGFNLYGKNGQSGYGKENLISGHDLVTHLKTSGKYDNWTKKLSDSIKRQVITGARTTQWSSTYNPMFDPKTVEKRNATFKSNGSGIADKNSLWNTVWISNLELRISKRISKDEKVPEGWIKKRIQDFDEYFSSVKERSTKEIEKDYSYLIPWYEIYNDVGFDKFVEITNYKFSQANLVSAFKRHVKTFVPQNGKRRGNK